MDTLKNVFCLVCMVMTTVASLFWFDSNLRNRSLTRQVAYYEQEMTTLRKESIQQAERYDDAQKQADKQMRRIQDEGKLILATKVPRDCNEAMKWALNEAHTFS